MVLRSEEACRYVWEGAIPLQIHLHESEVTTLPPPPPALILGPRVGYLPLLLPIIKPYFSNSLPPVVDTMWFDYKGVPLKWYIPTGVLFDMLCAEPERPWNITVHFRGYPGELLPPCETEDSVKWSFINSLKEAAYIINGNCKNVMNMSQADQFELWQSVLKGNMEAYNRISSRLKLGPIGEDSVVTTGPGLEQLRQVSIETEFPASNRPSRIPVRLYVRCLSEDLDNLEDSSPIDSWEQIAYLNRPMEVHKPGNYTLKHAMRILLPDIFDDDEGSSTTKHGATAAGEEAGSEDHINEPPPQDESDSALRPSERSGLSSTAADKMVRIQGIEPDLEIPFLWVVNNLMNPEFFLHICVFIGKPSSGTP